MNNKIKKIVVVGGGTSAWLTISTLLYKIHSLKNIEIICIESKDVPVIGVGESTTGLMWNVINYHDHIKNEKEFLKETGSTFKYGIKHVNWNQIGKSFVSPIGSSFNNVTNYPSNDYDYIRILHVADNLQHTEPLQNKLMLENKIYNENNHNYDVAYHIDSFKAGQYLKKKCLNTNRIKKIESTVEEIILNEKGEIKSLILKNKDIIEADFFIDCTGFHRVLINKLDTKFISYKDNLLVNRAITFPRKVRKNEIIKNYTTATARKYGWSWEIQLQERIGRGYVFNSNMIDNEQAISEMNKEFDEDITPNNIINFESGRIDKFWNKNVLAIGLSSSFVEPLEATAIHCTLQQINYFMDYYFTENLNMQETVLHDSYNKEMTNMWDDIRDFIVLHYISERKDTEFWRESSSVKRRSKELNEKLEKWKYRMPRTIDYSIKGNNFFNLGNSLWYQICMGMNILNSEVAKKELFYYNIYERAKQDLQQISNYSNNYVKEALTTNQFYKKLYE
jgi:tryptophan halogenase